MEAQNRRCLRDEQQANDSIILMSDSNQEVAPFIEKTQENRRRSNSSLKVIRAVKDAVSLSRRSSSQSSPVAGTPISTRSSSGTPVSSRKSLSSASPKSFRKKMWAKASKVKSAQQLVLEDLEADNTVPDDLCLITDGPDYTFKLAIKGSVKQLADLCNTNPDRLFALDKKGASLLHHAARANQVQVIEYILTSPGSSELLEATDDMDTTALHWATVADHAESVTSLIRHGADPMTKNMAANTAIHVAVQRNSLKALQAMIDLKVELNIRGNAGVTPLHVAAYADNAAAFQILMKNGAKPCMPCSQGYYPLHAAASAGAKNVMELLLQICHSYGYSRASLLSYGDKEKSSPLHCAVTGGNIVAIKLCLEHGARLDVKQADDSTPMHMVCGQGTLDIVEAMFEMCPEQASSSLFMMDKMDQTPLHKAAMFNHPHIIKYLLEKGADMEVFDVEERTPLILAASRECWASVETLIQHGANVLVKDKDERNLMHVVVLKGGDIKKINGHEIKQACRTLFQKSEVQQLLSQTDTAGCSPLHYACQEGNLASLKSLMELGVSARLKSAKKQSPLHFASMYGRYNACCRLLNSEQGPNIINEKDQEGMTPLHFAAKNGHVKVVQLLLNRGAILHRNIRGESVLHEAASSGYTKTIRALIETHNHLIDQSEEGGNTALHLAARNGHVSALNLLLDLEAAILRNDDGDTCLTEAIMNKNSDVAMAIVQHARWEEALDTFKGVGETMRVPVLLLIQYLPDVMVAVLNRCRETAEETDIRSKDYWIKYHFNYLEPTVENRQMLKRQHSKKSKQKIKFDLGDGDGTKPDRKGVALPALNKMVEFNRVQCLRHPVSVQYLRQKWSAYGRMFHSINFVFYLMSLFPITYIVSTVPSGIHWENGQSLINYTSEGTAVRLNPVTFTNFQIAMMIQATVVNTAQIFKELMQMYQQRMDYFLDGTNLVEWTLYTTSLLYITPFFTGYPVHWQFEFGSVAIFLAWFNLLVFLQKSDIAGIYVVMFLQILQTLVQVILVFSFLIVAFAFSFYVLMQDEVDKAFSFPHLAMMRSITMLLGEIGYVEKFLAPMVDNDPSTFHFSVPSMLLLMVFILMMPILLMNLLIGLAVGDIAEVQNNAVLQRLAMQVQLHSSIETRLPFNFLRRVDRDSVTIYPNKAGVWHKRAWNRVFKHTGIQDTYGDSRGDGSDPGVAYVQEEMRRQKQRLKAIQSSLDAQHDLLRLIVQKMEIRSEAEFQDEGAVPTRRASTLSRPYSSLPGHSGSKLMAIRAIGSMTKKK